ncbi:phenylalanine--tRNA ligase alpha subunit [Oceanisphaera arctica]|nr:phenylalanine--tRNA ligase alpha subunit [Oceanisphaera arctica]
MDQLEDVIVKAQAEIQAAANAAELDDIRVHYLGKKGFFTEQSKALGKLSAEERPAAGQIINKAKQAVSDAINSKRETLQLAELNQKLASETLDITLPGRRQSAGGLHPVSRTIKRIESFFGELGFQVAEGPEIEDDFHNFDALNIPAHHPARADHDTFYFNPKLMLRTQTSGVQIRTMEQQQPPIRIISPLVDENVSFTQLKGVLHDFLNNFFEEDLQIRFRPSYFPFTEPSAQCATFGRYRSRALQRFCLRYGC